MVGVSEMLRRRSQHRTYTCTVTPGASRAEESRGVGDGGSLQNKWVCHGVAAPLSVPSANGTHSVVALLPMWQQTRSPGTTIAVSRL